MLIYKEFDGVLATYKVEMNFSRNRFEVEEITIERLTSEKLINGTAFRKITIESVLREAFRSRPISIEELTKLPGAQKLLKNDEKLGLVALHYVKAWILNEEPVKAVEDGMGLYCRTASNWVSKARDASHIDFAFSFLAPFFKTYFALANIQIVEPAEVNEVEAVGKAFVRTLSEGVAE